MPPVLETRGLTVRFGGHVAVDAVSCAFHAGTLTAIVGPVGCGKSTLLSALLGDARALAGSIRAPHVVRALAARRHHRVPCV